MGFIINQYFIIHSIFLYPEYVTSFSHLMTTVNASSDVFIYFMNHTSEVLCHKFELALEHTEMVWKNINLMRIMNRFSNSRSRFRNLSLWNQSSFIQIIHPQKDKKYKLKKENIIMMSMKNIKYRHRNQNLLRKIEELLKLF